MFEFKMFKAAHVPITIAIHGVVRVFLGKLNESPPVI